MTDNFEPMSEPVQTGPLRVVRQDLPHASVLRLDGELDLASAPGLVAAVRAASEARPDVQLILDMRHVAFIDSTGLRSLLECADLTPRPLPLLDPSDPVRRVLELTQMSGRFPVVTDVQPDSLDVLG
ncbi:MAG: STAS domain-containing protein [Thermoleophilia bacterium]